MLKELKAFVLRPIASPAIEAIYRVCVAQARQPFFYADLKAPDTVEGRFDLLILHVFLAIARLQDHPKETQQLFDILFADMDKNLREMGVSDISIAKKMKPMLAAFYGRAKAYENALTGDDDSLSETLRRNIYGSREAAPKLVKTLTAYVRSTHAALAAQKTEDILKGKISFPVASQNE